MNISFKADIEGIRSPALKYHFEQGTQNDSKHKIVFVKGLEKYSSDTFTLYNNDKKTAEHTTEFNDEVAKGSIDRLFTIFDLLKKKEALAKIEELKNKNKNKNKKPLS